MVPLYRIRDWQTIYEVNRTRELKTVKWIPFPVKLHGDGYCQIMSDTKNGPAIFGTFVAMVELAACCTPRGDLLKSSGIPHDFTSIGRILRIDTKIVEATISFCSTSLNWIKIIKLDINCDQTASRCDITADAPVCSVIPVIPVPNASENLKHGKRSRIEFTPPTLEEFTAYCKENGFENIAQRAYKSYSAANPAWTDSRGTPIRSWKQKMQNVWFREDNKDKITSFCKPLTSPGLDAYYNRSHNNE